jgi:hypothetical protein
MVRCYSIKHKEIPMELIKREIRANTGIFGGTYIVNIFVCPKCKRIFEEKI